MPATAGQCELARPCQTLRSPIHRIIPPGTATNSAPKMAANPMIYFMMPSSTSSNLRCANNYHEILSKSTLRLPGINAGACSGLTLSGAFTPRLERRGLAPSNGSIAIKRLVKIIFLKSAFPLNLFPRPRDSIDVRDLSSFQA